MSTTIDQRVVEMRFDNKQFEAGVSSTMSTLDKLKQSLNLTGASKGLENISSVAKNVNLAPLSSAVETVQARFSALDVMATTALVNITNQAVNAGKRMVSALTIDPIMSGFSEYETQINAIQTILSNTESKGTTLDDVNMALDQLNTYADKTIYNFTEMTRNIGTFTAAGIDLDTSVNAIQGIANLAAISGSTSQQASTAMYQLSQALASGTVKLMDWNSVVNAGMGGQVFQDALKETARVHGVAIDKMIKDEGSFRETLKDGWLTADILTETLQKFTLTTDGLTDAQVQANREMLKAKGYTNDQIDAIFKLGKNATDAATKVKTFTQLWDTLKESAQSGWTQTWEMIIGDFGESRELFTKISDTMGEIIGKSADKRNTMLKGALTSPWEQLVGKMEEAGVEASTFEDKIKSVMKSHDIDIDAVIKKYGSLEEAFQAGALESSYLQEAVNALDKSIVDISSIKGIFGFGKTGEEVKKIQTALDKLGYDIGEKYGVDGIIGKYTTEAIKAFQEANNLKVDGIVGPETLAALEEATSKTSDFSKSCKELVDNVNKLGGRDLLIEAFSNIGGSVLKIFNAIGEAWDSIFPPKEKAQLLYNIIEGFHSFSEKLVISDDTAKNLTRTLKGVFAIVDILATILGGGFRLAIKVINGVLGMFNLDILSVTAVIGDAIVGFRDWMDSAFSLSGALEFITPIAKKVIETVAGWGKKIKNLPLVQKAIDKVKGAFENLKNVNFTELGEKVVSTVSKWTKAFSNLPIVQKAIEKVKNAFTKLKEIDYIELGKNIISTVKGWIEAFSEIPIVEKGIDKVKTAFENLKDIDFKEIGSNILEGLKNALSDPKSILDAIIELGKGLIESIKEVLGIHSPSKVFFAIGGFIVAGLLGGLTEAFPEVWETIKAFGSKCIEAFQGVDWGAILTIGVVAGILAVAYKMASALQSIAAPLEAFGEVAEGITDVTKGISTKLKADALFTAAKAIAVLVASIAALTLLDPIKVLVSIGFIAAIATILGVFVAAIGKFGPEVKDLKDFSSIVIALIGISAALLIMAKAFKTVAGIDSSNAGQAIVCITILSVIMFGLIKATNLFNKDATKVGSTLLLIAGSMLLLTIVMKMISKLSPREFATGLLGILAFVAFIEVLTIITNFAGKDADKLGASILKIVLAIGLLVLVAKLVSGMDLEDLIVGGAIIAAFSVLLAGMVLITRFAGGKDLTKLGTTLIGMSLAIAIMAVVATKLGEVDTLTLVKGVAAIAALTVLIGFLAIVAKLAGGNDLKKLGSTLLTMSIAIGILAIIAALLGMVDTGNLVKGLAAVTILTILMTSMTKAAGKAVGAMGSIIAITAAIVLLVGAMVLLAQIKDTSKLMTSVAALVLVMGTFSLAMVAASKAGKMSLGVLATIGVMMLVTAGLAALLLGMSALEIQNAMPNAIALSTLLIALSAAVAILTVVGDKCGAGAALKGALAFIVIVGLIGILVAAIGALAIGCEELGTFLDAGIPILEKIGLAIGGFFGGIVGGFASGVASALPSIGAYLTGFMKKAQGFFDGVQNLDGDTLAGVGIVAAAIIAMSAANLIEGLISSVDGVSSLPGLGKQLSKFMTNAQDFFAAVNDLKPEAMEGVKTLAEAIIILTGAQLVQGITSLIGGDVSFESFGEQIGHLGSGLASFVAAIAGVDLSGVEPAANALKTLAGVAQAIPNTGGLLADLVGDNDMEKWADKLMDLGGGLKDFTLAIKGIDLSGVEPAAKAIKTLAKVTQEIPNTGGALASLVGDNDMKKWADKLEDLGEGLYDFVYEIKDVDLLKVEDGAKAIKTLAKASQEIPNTGGKLAELLGDNDMGKWGDKLEDLGEGLYDFYYEIQNIKDFKTIDNGAGAIKALAKAAKEIPDTGGWLASLFGETDMEQWSKDMGSMGSGLAKFVSNLGENYSETKVDSAVKAIKDLASVGKTLSKDEWFAGKTSATQFSNDLSDVGYGISWFATYTKDVDTEKAANVAICAKKIATTISAIEDSYDLAIVGANLETFSTKFLNCYNNLSGMDAVIILSTEDKINYLIGVIRDVGEVDTSGIASFGNAISDLVSDLSDFVSSMSNLETVGADIISNLVSGIENNRSMVADELFEAVADAKTAAEDEAPAFKKAGEALAEAIGEGAGNKDTTISDAFTTPTFQAALDLYDYYSSFYSVGSFLVEGFVAGIDDNMYKATAKVAAMALAVKETAEEALGINSPSKVFYKIGGFTGQGFVNALGDWADKSRTAAADMADSARKGLSKAIRKVMDVITVADTDIQPTIRPVLDLSAVEAGAGTIGNMLGIGSTIGVRSDIGSISSSMNRRIQNGNDDVVSAINKLRKGLDNVGNTTYSINGITYDNGSEIADAVQSIVRAAKMGRRT